MMPRRLEYISLPPIVLGRMLGALLLISIVGFYFVGRDMGLIAPIYSEHETTPEERRALARHNAEVKRLIAIRASRAAAVRDEDHFEQVAQAARDAPPKPVVVPQTDVEANPAPE
jgi:hypothetical protein